MLDIKIILLTMGVLNSMLSVSLSCTLFWFLPGLAVHLIMQSAPVNARPMECAQMLCT